jgi:hypothetical protein
VRRISRRAFMKGGLAAGVGLTMASPFSANDDEERRLRLGPRLRLFLASHS